MVFYAVHKGGAEQFFAGPPQGKLAPSGGSWLLGSESKFAKPFACPRGAVLRTRQNWRLTPITSMGATKRLWIFLIFGTMHCSLDGELSTKILCGF